LSPVLAIISTQTRRGVLRVFAMTATAHALDRLIDQSCELYTLPTVAIKVLELTKNPQVENAALRACIENDPALTTKILRVVNSSLYGLSRQVSDLNQALALLGTKPLKLLVLGFSLPDALFANVACDVLARYWKRTLTRAVAAREICQSFKSADGDEAFIAGLLQDLGILVMIQGVGQPYVELLNKVYETGKDLAKVERQALRFDHRELTAHLMKQWGLPGMLSAAIEHSSPTIEDDPSNDDLPPATRVLTNTLRLADLVTIMLTERRTEVLSQVLDLESQYNSGNEASGNDGRLLELVDSLEEKVAQLADVLTLELPEGLDYGEVLEEAHRQLVQVAAQTAGDLVRGDATASPAMARPSQLDGEIDRLSAAADALTASPVRESAPLPASAGESRRARSSECGLAHRQEPAQARTRPSRPKSGGRTPVGDGVDPTLLARVTAVVAACRQARCPVSLLLIEVDHFADRVFSLGVETAQQRLESIKNLAGSVDVPGATCATIGEARFALILPNCDRQSAVQLGNDLIRQVRHMAPEQDGSVVTVSIGVSTLSLPPKNFPSQDLLDSANRCLYGAQSGGGDALKSIEIY